MRKCFILAAAAIAALSACTKENIVAPKLATAPVFTATIDNESATKVVLSEGSAADKMKVNWESGDEVKMLFMSEDALDGESEGTISTPVYVATPSSDNASSATLTLKDGESYDPEANIMFAAVYPASLYDENEYSWSFPATQVYKGDGNVDYAPMLFMNAGIFYEDEFTAIPETINFMNMGALLEITVPYSEMTSVRSITVSSNLRMNGELECSIYQDGASLIFDDYSFEPDSGDNQITLDCYSYSGSNVSIPQGGSKTFYISIIPNPVGYGIYTTYFQIDVTDGTTTKCMRTKTFAGTEDSCINIERNKIYPISFADYQAPGPESNLSTGKFSVSATKKVSFTKSNLYWNGSAFDFEENPTDYPTSFSENHVGHFYWTRSASASYAQSYSESDNTSKDKFFAAGNDADHMLTVAGLSDLYALSYNEWTYLLNIDGSQYSGRTQTARFAKAKLNEKNGFIIFPDDYSGKTSGDGIAALNSKTVSFPSATMSSETWATLEAAGVVFLPAAGHYNVDWQYVGSHGYYWTSTTDSSAAQYAYSEHFFNENIYHPQTMMRAYRCAIRLVKTVE